MKKLSLLLIFGIFLTITACHNSVSEISEESFSKYVAEFEAQISKTRTINADNKDQFVRQALELGFPQEGIDDILGYQDFIDYFDESSKNEAGSRNRCSFRKIFCFVIKVGHNRYKLVYSNSTDTGNYIQLSAPGHPPLNIPLSGQACSTIYTQPISCTDFDLYPVKITKFNGNGKVDCSQYAPLCSYKF